ncbi:MAG TPA: hypothetical protein VM694_31840, partial [Polyangium sp.]|nr:hypothetical protein [Polyangium sp.]
YCVVYKRGGAGLCVVTRDGARAEASLVTLDAPIADVAVTDTSVVVAFTSGKLALYEAASLAAPEGPKAPVSTTVAGGKGRPRVLLATTTKGATSIWIGTAEGEVMRAAVVEVAAAPEPPAAEPAAPVVEGPSREEVDVLRKEIASLRGALEGKSRELETVRGELDVKARELEHARGELDGKVRELQVVKGDLDGKSRELAVVRGELDEKTRDLATGRAELGGKIRELTAENRELDGKVRELQNEHRDLTNAKSDLARALEDLREERAKFEHSLGKRIDGVLPERARSGIDFVVSLVENRRR